MITAGSDRVASVGWGSETESRNQVTRPNPALSLAVS